MADVLQPDVVTVLESRRKEFERHRRGRYDGIQSLSGLDTQFRIKQTIRDAISEGMAQRYGYLHDERMRMLKAASRRRLTRAEIEKAMDAERGFWRR